MHTPIDTHPAKKQRQHFNALPNHPLPIMSAPFTCTKCTSVMKNSYIRHIGATKTAKIKKNKKRNGNTLNTPDNIKKPDGFRHRALITSLSSV
jgi:hypothetical protein